jgi:nicotinamidase-related amidase
MQQRVEDYILALENRGRYTLTIWPPHCLIGTWGYCVYKELWDATHEWELSSPGQNIDYVCKAANPLTEHYSGIYAEVPDPADPSTRTNFTLIDKLKKADRILVGGEALSHCVSNTLRDLTIYIPPQKITVLTDCMSNVQGFEAIGTKFVDEYRAKGMQFTESTTYELLP